MTGSAFCDSGLSSVGPLSWGTHFCQFYKTRDDLVDTLVPYFTAGLQNNEACLWVTSQPLVASDARAVMAAALPDFERYVESGQIEIIDFEDWYVALGNADADQVLAAWVERQQQALRRGYDGLRLTGNTFWLERSGWNDFMEYERKVNANFGKFRILGLCTYSLDRCGAEEVIDVVRNHQFAVALRNGEWEMVESASIKVAKEELYRVNQDLENRVRTRTADLEAALRDREEYMAVLAHELRNPLGAVSNAITVLEEAGAESGVQRRALEVARRQIHQQTRMVDDLLDVSRLTRGTFLLRMERADLADLCRRSVEDARQRIEVAGLRVFTHLPAGPVWVDCDPARLTQVLANLLENAAKFTPAGEVAVTLTRDESMGRAVLEVRDTGIGIAPELLSRVFQPFVQAEQTLDRTTGGLGLGLALVQGITELHGGQVSAESAGAGMGTRMTVTLPLAVANEEGPCEAPKAESHAGALRILVIEDLQDAAETLRDLLELWGHSVKVAYTGIDGLAAAERWRPEVVLCDLGLPGLDGYELARRLRQDPRTASIQLVAVTGYHSEVDRQRTEAAGFDAHLAKPLDVVRLRALLAARAAQRS